VRRLGLRDECEHRVISGTPLPEGWTGKGWACNQLSQAARGEFLFFTDADTAHAPGTVSATVEAAREYRADLVSAWPRLLTVTLGEKLIIPMILVLGLSIYPHWLVCFYKDTRTSRRECQPSRAAASGRPTVSSCSSPVQATNASAATRRCTITSSRTCPSAAPSRRIWGEGMRLLNCDSQQFSTCRMYRSFAETWEGFTKNMRAAFEDSLAGFLFIGATQFCGFRLPFVFLFVAPAFHPLIAVQIAIIYLIRLVLAWRFRTSWLSAFLHPLGEALCLGIGLNSWRRLASKGVQWKGRTYQTSRGNSSDQGVN